MAYGERPVLNQLSLSVPQGETLALLGANGAGKSTTLKAALGLIPVLSGSARFFGQPLAKVRQRVGYMPQAAEVDWNFPTTVADVVTMGTYGRLGWCRRPGRKSRDRSLTALEQVGIPELADRHIAQLSGGQKQRTFLARILAQDPELFIMDEPFAGVDAGSERAITSVLRDLHGRGKTIVIVHHNLATVRDFCTWTALLKDGAAHAHGPTAEVFRASTVAEAYGLDVFAETPGHPTSAARPASTAGTVSAASAYQATSERPEPASFPGFPA